MKELTFYIRNSLILRDVVKHLEKLGFKPDNPYALSVVNEHSVDASDNPYYLIGTPYTNKVVVYDDGLKGAYYVIQVRDDPSDTVPIEILLAADNRQEVFELIYSLDETEEKTMKSEKNLVGAGGVTLNPVLEFNTYLPTVADTVIKHLESLDMKPTPNSFALVRGDLFNTSLGKVNYLKVTLYGDNLLGVFDVSISETDAPFFGKNTIDLDNIMSTNSKDELLHVIVNKIDKLIKGTDKEVPEETIAPVNQDTADSLTIYLKDGTSKEFPYVKDFSETEDTITFKGRANTFTIFKSALQGYSTTI